MRPRRAARICATDGGGRAHRTKEVDLEKLLRLGERGLFERADKHRAGVVDQEVDATGVAHHLVNKTVDRFVVTDIDGAHDDSGRPGLRLPQLSRRAVDGVAMVN